jgi:hypothetical protein
MRTHDDKLARKYGPEGTERIAKYRERRAERDRRADVGLPVAQRRRSGTFPKLPDPAVAPEPVARLIREDRDLAGKITAARSKVDKARQDVEAAKTADEQAAAEAVRAGKQPPKPSADKAETKVAEAAGAHRSLVAARQQVRADLAETVVEHAAGWLDELDVREDNLRAEMAEPLATLAGQVGRLEQLRGLAGWVRSGADGSFRPAGVQSRTVTVDGRRGRALRRVVQALADELTVRPEPPADQEPAETTPFGSGMKQMAANAETLRE